ncbi:VanZ family protein [Cryobacterium sp. Sr8]|uniref:VanZ family protein n=1 Tax=Cryobacterium sp. Sr8 TaxID=1259203 RepID=UPI00106B3217|nr:VanZ family protein [Cryobacterium sp. Sr8]TFD79372.1 VanZ family protein [Cryobacterium sp. Sr8]
MSGVDTVQRSALHRRTLFLTFSYLIALALIAFWPSRVDRDAGDLLGSVVGWLHWHGAPRWMHYDVIEFGANIALFVPVGLFVVILAGASRWWLGLVVGFTASCVIELGQLAFVPARFATVNDVVANTAGATAGAAAAVLLLLALGVPADRRL